MKTSVDGHVHTALCHHARGSMEAYVQAAIARGLAKIVFLEHLEWGISYPEPTWLSAAEFADYHRQGARLQKKYGQDITIGLGVEVGYNPDHVRDIRLFLERYQWDRIGISYHFIATPNGHINVVSRRSSNLLRAEQYGLERLVRDYYAGLEAAVIELPGTVLCHLDAVLRHHPDIHTINQQGFIDRLLHTVARQGMALEVNTSGFPLRGRPYPDSAVWRRARRLGIALWPGSDAHQPADVGRYFDRLNGEPV